MKALVAIAAWTFLVGCGPPPPVPKSTHILEVQKSIVRAGGLTSITNESRTLFACLSKKKREANFYGAEDACFRAVPGITNLGDVFRYTTNQPDRIEIRVYNSHFDVYFIHLLNPDYPEPAGFERIAGNVGFIEPGAAANRSQPIRFETNPAPSAAGSRR